jgi:hypothetical protein
MSIPSSVNPLFLGAAGSAEEGGYLIERSLRFNSPDSAYLSRTPSVSGNRKTWTWAGWVKRSKSATQFLFSSVNSATQQRFGFISDKLYWVWAQGTAGLNTAAVFRDYAAWYHIQLVSDTDNATAANRIRIYVNGASQSLSGDTVSSGEQWDINTTIQHAIGAFSDGGGFGSFFDGYLADIHFIDGQALDPTSFGEFDDNGIWQPKAYTGSYGTNGGQLKFEDNSSNTATTLGKDTSGLNNDWTPVNLSTTTGGPTSVAAASGALPVYNTTGTYGDTKGSGTRTDSNSSSIVLALPMEGANNGTTFTDEHATIKGSGSAKTITRNGDTKTSTAQSKFYGSSGFFDGSGDYLRINGSSDTGFSAGTAFTIECWIRGSNLGSTPAIFGNRAFVEGNSFTVYVTSSATNTLQVHVGGGTVTYFNVPGGLANDTWHHIAMTRNTSNVVSFYANGILVGTGSPSSDLSYADFFIGCWGTGNGSFYEGYIQDFRIYKGVAKYTTNFNPPSSTANATIAAGNDSLVDVPTNGTQTDTGAGGQVRGNYCTWNPLAKGSDCTLSNGNLDVAWGTASGSQTMGAATFGVSSGKWYWETTITASSASPTNAVLGITTKPFGDSEYPGYSATSWGYRGSDGQKWNNTSGASYGASYANGDVVGVAFDADNGTLTFYKNGSSQGTAYTGLTSGPYFPAIGDQSSAQTFSAATNFGQRPFAYTAPSGFKALNTANLPAPTIVKGSDYFDTKLYTGNGSTQTISGLGFSPDFVWIKARDTNYSHQLIDIIRGGTKPMFSDRTDAEGTFQSITSFNSDGYTVSTELGVNGSGTPFVAWTWDAGDNTVTNDVGSISSQVRANASAGFSIVTWTVGTAPYTVGHGLNAEPYMIITKSRTGSGTNWGTYHRSTGNQSRTYLNLTLAASSGESVWNNTTPTSTVFSLGSSGEFSGDMVAYCFAPVAGYSSFGSYTGNGSADGPFVYTGFRPRWIMIKRSSSGASGGNWIIKDTSRPGYNTTNLNLFANSSTSETTEYPFDILSNGFKIRETDIDINASGGTYVWAAFAEHPFQYARAR